MSTESASNSTSNVPVYEAAQESKDNSRLQQLSPQLFPANYNRVSQEEMISGSEFLINGKDLARVWDQVESMKAAIEELRSKIEENRTVKVVQSELTILRERLCESIDKLGTKLPPLERENNGQASGSQDAHPNKKSSVVPTSTTESAESKSPTSIQRTPHTKSSAKDESHNFFEGGIPENCKFEELIGFLRKALDRSPLSEEESKSLIIQLESIFRFQEDKSLELQKECEQAKSQVEVSKMEHAEMQSSIMEEDKLKSQLKSLQEEKLRVESEFKEKENLLKTQLQEVKLKMENEMKDLECKGLKEHNESLKRFVNVFDKTIDRVPKSAEEPLKLLAKQELSKVNANTSSTTTDAGETSSLADEGSVANTQ